MAHPSHMSPDNILRFLQVKNGPASATEIAQGLHLKKSDNRPLFKMLSKIKKRRAIEELPGGRYRLPSRKPERESPGQKPLQEDAARHPQSSPLAGRDEVKGRLVLHHDGYGFVVPDSPIPQLDGDVFIPPNAIQDAMHGDHVLAKIQRLGGVTGAQRAEGRILRILDRAHPTVVGLFRYGSNTNVVLPYDVRIQHEIEIPRGNELTPGLWKKLGFSGADETSIRSRRIPRLDELDGAVVNVELLRYPQGGASATGRVIEILGRPGDLGVDTEIIIRKHHLPHSFSAEVLDEAERGAKPVSETQRAGREDFRHLPIVTIDGETARDFDDAVHVERRGPGWHLQVHIADVSHYVRVANALDGEARLRGTSVYFPDRAVPMLPEELSNGICSLNPHVDRLVMSAVMEIDASGSVAAARFTQGVIRSAERMTYTNVNKVLEGDAEATSRYAALVDSFRRMRELALLLNARRERRGSIDFDLPEPVIEFDAMGRMVGIVRSERNIANRLIEEFMLTANEAVAGYLERRGLASLHRVHEKPDAKKVLEFEELAHAFGYSLGVADLTERRLVVKHGRVPAPARSNFVGRAARGRERQMTVALPGTAEIDIRPQHYQRLTEKIAGKPEERILSYLMLRSLKQARYAAEPLGHFALAFDQYTHFTSPIRRYPDLIVHRVLKWALAHPEARAHPGAVAKHGKPAAAAGGKGAAEAGLGPYRRVELEEIAEESSEAERRANGAERELMDWKTAQFMESHLGEEYDALVISVQKFGFF